MNIRMENSTDADEIWKIHSWAFETEAEANPVNAYSIIRRKTHYS
jgi:predicted N-acetyltransferase YhbS